MDLSLRTRVTARSSVVLKTGCSTMMLSPLSNCSRKRVQLPWTVRPLVVMVPIPATGSKLMRLSSSTMSSCSSSSFYSAFLALRAATVALAVPSLNFSFPIRLIKLQQTPQNHLKQTHQPLNNYMNVSGQLLFGSTLPTEGVELEQIGLKECRICLQNQSEGQNSVFVEPCLCAGSLQFVHFNCLSRWIVRCNPRLLRQQSAVVKFPCEMCKHEISLEVEESWSCRSRQELMVKIRQKIWVFILLLTITVLCMALLLAGSLVATKQEANNPEGRFAFIILVICSAIVGVLLLVLAYVWTSDYLIKEERIISKINNFNAFARAYRGSVSLPLPRLSSDYPHPPSSGRHAPVFPETVAVPNIV